MEQVDVSSLKFVNAQMSYTVPMTGTAQVRVFPPSSGRNIETPDRERKAVRVYDCRPIAQQISLDVAGFELHDSPTGFDDWYNPEHVREAYYPEAAAIMKEKTGALEVFVFDHNVRNQPRADRQEQGVREPVDGAHNDYTLNSGPRRIREILAENNASHLAEHRTAIINLWRPIKGPVQDHPVAICDARTTRQEDFIPTEITHFLEGDLENPSLTGQIYSFTHSDQHRWFYVSDMQPNEILLLKCYDSATDGRAVFTGHTGFPNPDCPPEFIPRESIEARTVVVFPEKA